MRADGAASRSPPSASAASGPSEDLSAPEPVLPGASWSPPGSRFRGVEPGLDYASRALLRRLGRALATLPQAVRWTAVEIINRALDLCILWRVPQDEPARPAEPEAEGSAVPRRLQEDSL